MIPQSGKPAIPQQFDVDSNGGEYVLTGESRILYIACEGSAKLYFSADDWANDRNSWPLFGDEETSPQKLEMAVTRLWLRSKTATNATVTILNVMQS